MEGETSKIRELASVECLNLDFILLVKIIGFMTS